MARHVKLLILIGDTAQAIRQAVEQAPSYADSGIEIVMADDLADAVNIARSKARSGDVVVLSPACAAFDHFKNFMERGKKFKELVEQL